jgi:hypothetical protein
LTRLVAFSVSNKSHELIELAFQGIAQMCSFSGSIFRNQSDSLSFLTKLLQIDFSLLDLRFTPFVGITGGSLIQISDIISRTIENFRGVTLLSLGEITNALLLKIANFSVDILKWLHSETDQENRKQLEEAFEQSLQNLVLIVSSNSFINEQEEQTNGNNNKNTNNNNEISKHQTQLVKTSIECCKELASVLFQEYVETKLTIAMLDLTSSDDR